MNNNYYVIAIRFDETAGKQVKYIAGQFEDYNNAKIFRNAYNDIYCANAEILTAYDMLNRVE